MSVICEVVFMANQGSEDLFFCPDNKRVYCRQPSNNKSYVVWLTTSKWSGGYEASSPLKDEIVVRVVDRLGNILFEEQNVSELAEKKYLFSYEQLKNISDSIFNLFDLKTFEEWKKWMLNYRNVLHEDKYSDDRWLYTSKENQEPLIVDVEREYYIYGKKRFILYKMYNVHTFSSVAWYEYEFRYDDDTIAEVAGYYY